jgi:hypothetical protein
MKFETNNYFTRIALKRNEIHKNESIITCQTLSLSKNSHETTTKFPRTRCDFRHN